MTRLTAPPEVVSTDRHQSWRRSVTKHSHLKVYYLVDTTSDSRTPTDDSWSDMTGSITISDVKQEDLLIVRAVVSWAATAASTPISFRFSIGSEVGGTITHTCIAAAAGGDAFATPLFHATDSQAGSVVIKLQWSQEGAGSYCTMTSSRRMIIVEHIASTLRVEEALLG